MGEREVTFPSERTTGTIRLEGRLHLPAACGISPAVVLCHPHPMGGGEMDVGLIIHLAVSLCALGNVVLRFNFGGVAGSEGDFTDGIEEPGDVRAACDYLHSLDEVGGDSISVAGWSFGSWMGLMALADGLSARSIVAIAPPLIVYDWRSAARLIAQSSTSRHYIVGERDHFCPLGVLKAFASAVSDDDAGKITVLDGADHFFFGREGEVARLVAEKIGGP